jgi:hypothetical protein
VIDIAEYRRLRGDPPTRYPQADVLDRWLERLITVYRDRVLPVIADIADEWGRLRASDPPPAIDG